MRGAHDLVKYFRAARQSNDLVVLEGFHAIKHALRFGAKLEKVVISDEVLLQSLIESHAPDLRDKFESGVETVDDLRFSQLSPHPPESGMIAVAKHPQHSLDEVFSKEQLHPIVMLDNPSHPGNIGSVVRVAAAADAHAVIATGSVDLWRPQILRGSVGLHFALPVLNIESLPSIKKPIIVFDERGEDVSNVVLPSDSIFVFGSERQGVSMEIKNVATKVVSIPMRQHVSSLNLATSVGIALYLQKQ